MSRYADKLPFSPHYDFQARKVMTLNGRAYVPGETIDKEGLGDRRLRQLYDFRMITPTAPEQLPPVITTTASVPTGETFAETDSDNDDALQADGADFETDGSTIEGDQDGQDNAQDNADQDTAAELPRIEHRGFGRWFLMLADGTEQGPLAKAAAEKAIAALKG